MQNNWKNICVTREATLREAMQLLDKSGLRVVFVLNDENTLLGVVTDGDIRRGFLRNETLDSPVSLVMNSHPLVASPEEKPEAIQRTMIQKSLLAVPIVDKSGQIVGLETIDSVSDHQRKNCSVVLMAGGYGKRLHPLTQATPKPMLNLRNKPVLECIIESFVEQGFTNFYVSTHYKADVIRDYFKDGEQFGCSIDYVHEDQPLGTVGALGFLNGKLNEDFILMNADIVTRINFKNLLEFHKQHEAIATMCVRENTYQVPYGVVEIEDSYIRSVHEKPQYTNHVNAGIYCFSPRIFECIPPNTYLDIPNLFQNVIKKGEKITAFPIQEYWIDIGRMEDYQAAILGS